MFVFVSKSDLYNFPDDNTLSSCRKILDDIMSNLKFDLEHIPKCFKINSLKPNPGKFEFMILRTNTDNKVRSLS